PAPPRTLPAATLLYVEDNASNIALMRRVLGLIGPQLSLHVAEDGFQGLALARDLRPDVVLTDINLPGMDGFELRRRLAQEPLTQDTPVLALSARALADDRRRGLEAGFVDYLAKPLDIAALADALALALAPLITREAGGLEEAA
ncbi:MAG: response regulator, partial [Brevundimonas sp.]